MPLLHDRSTASEVVWQRFHLLAGVMCVLAVSLIATAAVVVTDTAQLSAGYLAVPVVLQSGDGEEIAGLQFDVNFDAAQYDLVDVVPGHAALDAGKDTVLAELGEGWSRVLIMGINEDALSDGVVATIYLKPINYNASPSLPDLDALLASDAFGNAVDIVHESAVASAEEENVPAKGDEDTARNDGALAEEPRPAAPNPSADGAPFTTGGISHAPLISAPQESAENLAGSRRVADASQQRGARVSRKSAARQPRRPDDSSGGVRHAENIENRGPIRSASANPPRPDAGEIATRHISMNKTLAMAGGAALVFGPVSSFEHDDYSKGTTLADSETWHTNVLSVGAFIVGALAFLVTWYSLRRLTAGIGTVRRAE